MNEMVFTAEQVEEHIGKINAMDRIEMCKLYRFAPLGHPYFNTSLPFFAILDRRYKSLGGMNAEISKQIG